MAANKYYTANLITIGDNPLGLAEDSNAILIKNKNSDKEDFLNGLLLYPDNGQN